MNLKRVVLLALAFLGGLLLVALISTGGDLSQFFSSSPDKLSGSSGGDSHKQIPDNGLTELSGLVLPLTEKDDSGATHQLLDEEGQVVALLKTDDDKLEFSQGFKVTVRGVVRKLGNGVKVMQVEEVGYLVGD